MAQDIHLRVHPGSWAVLVSIALLTACSSREEPGGDGGGMDAGPAETDAGPGDMDAGGEPDAGDVDAGPLTGDTYLYVVSRMDLGFADPEGDPTVVPGFDVDGRVSDASDQIGCRKRDYTSPPPESEPGVDNQLGPILAQLEDSYHIRQNMTENVQSGDLLVLLRVRGVDDLDEDDRIEVDALVGLLPAGVTVPALDGMGRIDAGQTFDLDAAALAEDEMTALVTLRGRIEGGRLRAGPGDFTMSLPLSDTRVAFEAKNAQVVFDITETSLAGGVMGGQLDVDGTVAAMEGVEGFDASAARLVLEANADLDHDEAAHECRAISIALVFDGAGAVAGTVRDPAAL